MLRYRRSVCDGTGCLRTLLLPAFSAGASGLPDGHIASSEMHRQRRPEAHGSLIEKTPWLLQNLFFPCRRGYCWASAFPLLSVCLYVCLIKGERERQRH